MQNPHKLPLILNQQKKLYLFLVGTAPL